MSRSLRDWSCNPGVSPVSGCGALPASFRIRTPKRSTDIGAEPDAEPGADSDAVIGTGPCRRRCRGPGCCLPTPAFGSALRSRRYSRSVVASRRNADQTGRDRRLEEMTSAAYRVTGRLDGRCARRALPSSNFSEAFHRSRGLREKSEAWHAPLEVLGLLNLGVPEGPGKYLPDTIGRKEFW